MTENCLQTRRGKLSARPFAAERHVQGLLETAGRHTARHVGHVVSHRRYRQIRRGRLSFFSWTERRTTCAAAAENISSFEMENRGCAPPRHRDVAVHAVKSALSEDEVKVTAVRRQVRISLPATCACG